MSGSLYEPPMWPFTPPNLTAVADQTPLRSFAGVSPSRYRHAMDASAHKVLSQTGGVDMLISSISQNSHESARRHENLTTNLRVGERQLPGLHSIFIDCCTRLAVPSDIELFIGKAFNAWTSGVDLPYVTIGDRLLGSLTIPQLRFVIGHELGHVVMQHQTYMSVATALAAEGANLTLAMKIPVLGKVLTTALQLALLKWSRVAEFSADRAGLLACQDFHAAASALIMLKEYAPWLTAQLSVEGVIDQASHLPPTTDTWLEAIMRMQSEGHGTHPWMVMRVAELKRWYDSADYQQLLEDAPLPGGVRVGLVNAIASDSVCAVCQKLVPALNRFCSACGAPVSRSRLVTSPAGGSQ